MNRYQYAVVRFVPDIVRDEAVNVGVLVREVDTGEFSSRFISRNSTVRKLWPQADDRLVENFKKQLSTAIRNNSELPGIGKPTSPEFFGRAKAEFNGNLQLTPIRGTQARSADDATDYVYETYVAPPAGTARPINFQAIAPFTARRKLLTAFERRGLVRPGVVREQVVVRGQHAPWTFDLVYRNGALNLVNSVALNAPTPSTNLGRALVLKGMFDDVRASRDETINGIAVVEVGAAGGTKESTKILKDAEVEVVPSEGLSKFVERVAEELKQAS